MTQTEPSKNPETLHLPRILCLHGGGVNAQVFELQCRVLISHLKNSLRLVFMQAPFISAPHPDIVTVYGEFGPFRRWLRWEPDHPEIEPEVATETLRNQTRRAMDSDPGTGEWIGIMGFSQGAKIAASLLWTQQKVTEQFGAQEALTQFKFGVLMAGRAPLITLDHRLEHTPPIVDAALLSSEFKDYPESNEGEHVLSIPTLHVHGLRDAGLEQHRILMERYCETGTTSLVEWDGGHRIPIKSHDVGAVTHEILKLARDAGVKLPN
ncbi:related to oxidoreductase [Fusarium torulosum]|uniref:Related to oxidoreductase n=1 Tax=Fusarium torulosum TaxID=33205 RepID=A0AAE8SH46_9HYPO|nr:related to oxidoreductase [Fusarium torulosum]